ncbi:MAG: TIGR03960 family B12-binding radical SAM protein [bacterium]
MEIITSVLRKINKPGRYFAPFIEPVKIKGSDLDFKILIVFPDLFEVAQSHAGIKILYSVFRRAGFKVDFGFAPEKDFFKVAKDWGTLKSMMYGIDYSSFDLICVSFQYQLQYPAFLKMLELGKIPITSKKRKEGDFPLVVAGGPVMCNPEPISNFIDAAFIGEFEPSASKVVKVLKETKGRENILKELSKIEGFYIPETENDTNVSINKDGSLTYKTAPERAILSDLNYDIHSLFDAPIFAMRTVHDRFTIEIMRGCTRGCRFCMAGSFYRPHREKSLEKISEILDKVVQFSGYDEVGFLSLSAGDHSEITEILVESYSRYGKEISVSLPSLRTETLTSEIIAAIKKGRKGGFTIAPESGSERLRNVINKDNTNDEILEAVRKIFSNGWNGVKLYFMLGLPLETDEDLFETVALLKQICSLARTFGKKATVTASFSTFIPQPFTPFQWEKMASPKEIRAKQKIIIENLRNIKNLKLNWHSQATSTVEAYLSRAGREFNTVIEYVAKKMTALQTEDESFDLTLWDEALAHSGINPKETMKAKPLDLLLPYEHINMKIKREFLIKEREKAYRFEKTADCATAECGDCGTCDFNTVKPRLKEENPGKLNKKQRKEESLNRGNSYPYIFTISKKGRAISVGHLDFVSFLFKVLSLSGLKVLYSDGFHPMPRFSLAFPTPVGVETEGEFGTVWLTDAVDEEVVLKKLNSTLEATGISFGSFKQIEREMVKKVEKVLRTLPIQSYVVEFKDSREFENFKSKEGVVKTNEERLTLFFEHDTTKQGFLKLFENIEGEYHISKKSCRDKLLLHDTEGVLRELI